MTRGHALPAGAAPLDELLRKVKDPLVRGWLARLLRDGEAARDERRGGGGTRRSASKVGTGGSGLVGPVT